MKTALIIQTAFIGDVILATPLIESLYQAGYEVDFLLRKGNESLLQNHPKLRKILIWDKSQNKLQNLLRLVFTVRSCRYGLVLCLQRFASGGILGAFSGGRLIVGFDKNPLSWLFHRRMPHRLGQSHECQRNLSLLKNVCPIAESRPRLYPTFNDYEYVKPYQSKPYITISPASVWKTKQLIPQKWIELIERSTFEGEIYLLGSKADQLLCQSIAESCQRPVSILAGRLSLLQSAALMKNAVLNYVNDSAPLHLASSVNAPVCAVFCSTIPEFGFGPLSDVSTVVEVRENLPCRPCGLHGYKKCPKKHFDCAKKIKIEDLLKPLQTVSSSNS